MLYLKAFHIIGVVVWFSGLFYIARLYVYHREAEDRPEPEKQILKTQFELMEKRLWYAITWPGLYVTVIFGGSLLYYFPLSVPWLHVKLSLVALLLLYHWRCGALRKQLASGQFRWSSKQLRMFNEIPSLLLIAIVCVVVLKDSSSWITLLLILAATGMVIGGTVQFLARRGKKQV